MIGFIIFFLIELPLLMVGAIFEVVMAVFGVALLCFIQVPLTIVGAIFSFVSNVAMNLLGFAIMGVVYTYMGWCKLVYRNRVIVEIDRSRHDEITRYLSENFTFFYYTVITDTGYSNRIKLEVRFLRENSAMLFRLSV